ncbi:MAG: hypothetical protein ACO1OY_05140 [Ramlibacter sp.]
MRAKSILLVIAILLVAGFAAMNWAEIVRPSSLWIGPVIMDAPLGAILLGLLAITLVLFLASTAAMRTQSLIDYRHHQKTLEAQRDLADKAEASRFTDLRTHLDTRLRELHERDKVSVTEMEKARLEHQRELRTQLEQMNRMLSARLNELEHRLEARLERAGHGGPVAVTPAVPARTVVPQQPVRTEPHEHAMAREEQRELQARDAQAHQAQMREEERMRDERIREEREARAQTDRPAESGWRRWF